MTTNNSISLIALIVIFSILTATSLLPMFISIPIFIIRIYDAVMNPKPIKIHDLYSIIRLFYQYYTC